MGSWLISFARRRNLVPRMSATELEALAAGTVWVDGEIPPGVLSFLRARGFFGLTVPKEYGGRAFSALACSEVFGKLTTRSAGLSAYVVIPNSVGPAELL